MKKIISLVLASVLFLSLPVLANVVTDEQKQDLKEFGIMVGDQNGDLRLNNTITRAEAIKMICVAGNFDAENAEQKGFPDVPKTHWAHPYILAAYENGIVEGDENGNFNPDSHITNEEIIKMAVSLLGYSPMAETRGGYPAGYTAAATSLGLTKDMQFVLNTPAIRNDVAKVIGNALDIPLMRKTSFDENAEYQIMNGENGVGLVTLRKILHGNAEI